MDDDERNSKADLSLALLEGHVNSLVLLDGMADDEQRARWFEGVVERGEKWVAWSGEPQARKPGEALRFGTTVEKSPVVTSAKGIRSFQRVRVAPSGRFFWST